MFTVRRNLLTHTWDTDLRALESAIERLTRVRPLTNDCRVAFFEIPGDAHLHVNVTHRHRTVSPAGWAGPGQIPDGFVHNRRFSATPLSQLTRHVRDMVFAGQID